MKLGGHIPTQRMSWHGMLFSVSANGQLIGGSKAMREAWHKDRALVLKQATIVKAPKDASKSPKSEKTRKSSSTNSHKGVQSQKITVSSHTGKKISKGLLTKISNLEKALNRSQSHLNSIKSAIM